MSRGLGSCSEAALQLPHARAYAADPGGEVASVGLGAVVSIPRRLIAVATRHRDRSIGFGDRALRIGSIGRSERLPAMRGVVG